MNKLKWKVGLGCYQTQGRKGAYIVSKASGYWQGYVLCDSDGCGGSPLLGISNSRHEVMRRVEQLDSGDAPIAQSISNDRTP